MWNKPRGWNADRHADRISESQKPSGGIKLSAFKHRSQVHESDSLQDRPILDFVHALSHGVVFLLLCIRGRNIQQRAKPATSVWVVKVRICNTVRQPSQKSHGLRRRSKRACSLILESPDFETLVKLESPNQPSTSTETWRH